MLRYFWHPKTEQIEAAEREETVERLWQRGFIEITQERYRAWWQFKANLRLWELRQDLLLKERTA